MMINNGFSVLKKPDASYIPIVWRYRKKDIKVLKQLFGLALSASVLLSSKLMALDLIIPAGGEYRIEQSELVLERLRLGKGAKLTLAPSVKELHLSAKQVWIEDQVVLDFSAANGAKGNSPLAMAAQTQYCKSGARGAPGERGGDGSNGAKITLALNILALGKSQLLVRGGNGGAGGNGAQGQAGGDAYQCRGGAGGKGGHAGAGGNGGNGGQLFFNYQLAESINLSQQLDISVTAGLAGPAGIAGVSGNGGKGRYSKIGGRNAKKWLAGGNAGQQGETASVGMQGSDGQLVLQQKKMLALKSEMQSLSITDTKLQALLRRLQQLEARVQALEAAKK